MPRTFLYFAATMGYVRAEVEATRVLSLVGLAEARDPGVVGGKAATLGRALRAGLPVPDGVVIPAASVDLVAAGDPGAVRELTEALPSGCTSLAVRSSACDEDGRVASHAGVFDTRLGVAPKGLAAAVGYVAASARAPHVASYRRHFGLPAAVSMAVLVQRWVRADVSGVMFTHHPVTGGAGPVVELVDGPAEPLVSGRADPIPASRRLTAEQTSRLDQLAAACTALFGSALDLEWAFTDDELFLIQVRPITAGVLR